MFSLTTLVLAFAALIVAAQAMSRSNDAKREVAQLSAGGAVATSGTVHLQEFAVLPSSLQYRAGKVTLSAKNVGTMTHEMVLVRAAGVGALPKVTVAGGERVVGDVDEEAVAKADTIGETGDVKVRQTVTKTFTLTRGTYVMFCNIDDKLPDGTVVSHFQRGMSATITVQ